MKTIMIMMIIIIIIIITIIIINIIIIIIIIIIIVIIIIILTGLDRFSAKGTFEEFDNGSRWSKYPNFRVLIFPIIISRAFHLYFMVHIILNQRDQIPITFPKICECKIRQICSSEIRLFQLIPEYFKKYLSMPSNGIFRIALNSF